MEPASFNRITVVNQGGSQSQTGIRRERATRLNTAAPIAGKPASNCRAVLRLVRSTAMGDEVDRARNRIRTVNRGLRASDDFHPLERAHVDGRHIKGSATTVGRIVHLNAVNQDLCVIGVTAAKVNRAHTAQAPRLINMDPGHMTQQIDCI